MRTSGRDVAGPLSLGLWSGFCKQNKVSFAGQGLGVASLIDCSSGSCILLRCVCSSRPSPIINQKGNVRVLQDNVWFTGQGLGVTSQES